MQKGPQRDKNQEFLTASPINEMDPFISCLFQSVHQVIRISFSMLKTHKEEPFFPYDVRPGEHERVPSSSEVNLGKMIHELCHE